MSKSEMERNNDCLKELGSDLVRIESSTLLSASRLWPMLKDLYAKEALNAWHEIGTPCYLTSTPFLAHQWAQIAFNFFVEMQHKTPFTQPWTIMELGAGSGRFAHLFLRRFSQLYQQYRLSSGDALPSWRYLLLDISPPMLEFWQNHPDLESFWQQGHLDAGLFDLEETQAIQLIRSGDLLKADTFLEPIVAIAGYLIDTLPGEAFQRGGEAIEPLVWDLEVPREALEKGVTAIVEQMRYNFTPLADSRTHALSQMKGIDELFEQYKHLLPVGCSFSISHGALQLVDRLKSIAPQGVLFLSGDQGYGDALQLRAIKTLELGRHGTASLPVNYDALARLLQARGDRVCLSSISSHKFVQLAAFLGPAQQAHQSIAFTRDLLACFDMENYWRLVELLEKEGALDIDLLYLVLKLGHWDPVNFFCHLPAIELALASFDELQASRWLLAMEEVLHAFYPTAAGDTDLLARLGQAAATLGDWRLAALAWQKALCFDVDRAVIHFNLALALLRLNDKTGAMEHFILAEKLDPQFSLEARGLI